MSPHISEDDLTLYYYGDTRRRDRIERHLGSCAACAEAYREIASTLAMIAELDAPERGDTYGAEVWQRIRTQLPARELGLNWLAGLRGYATLAAAAAALVLVAFLAGRSGRPIPPSAPAPPAPATTARDDSRRILIAAVADHLDRSERVLTDIVNAPAESDISAEQAWADDLLATSRLYRQDAIAAGETSIAAVLDDLERNLVEIVHSPSPVSAADIEQIRRRVDAAALLFKVRVMGDELRRREAEPTAAAAPRPRRGTIG